MTIEAQNRYLEAHYVTWARRAMQTGDRPITPLQCLREAGVER